MADDDQRPVPDPTSLTTEQLLREVNRVQELMTAELVGLRNQFEERFARIFARFDLTERLRQEKLGETVSLKEHIEAILTEQRTAMSVAEEEREKSARALRAELARAIEEGDRNLREHIQQQIQQIQAALISAEKLEIQRFEAVREAVSLSHDASERAVAKAEAATEKRFEEVDQWRSQTAERERTQQEQQTALAGTFMPREVAEAQMNELRRAIADLTAKLSKIV